MEVRKQYRGHRSPRSAYNGNRNGNGGNGNGNGGGCKGEQFLIREVRISGLWKTIEKDKYNWLAKKRNCR